MRRPELDAGVVIGLLNADDAHHTSATQALAAGQRSGVAERHPSISSNAVTQSGNFTITSVTMTFPAGSDITGFGNFVISHPSCGTVTTTTTTVAPTTTTTVAPTTTTTTLVLSGHLPDDNHTDLGRLPGASFPHGCASDRGATAGYR